MAQQRRAWEELNRIFGGTTPPPPGPDPPDPPGPDPPDPPGPDPPDPPDPMVYDCVFEKSMTTWMGSGLEGYVMEFEVEPGVRRPGFYLRPNLCLLCWTDPQVGFSGVSYIDVYRNGQPVGRSWAIPVEVQAPLPGLFEYVGYDPHENRFFLFCSHPPEGVSSYTWTDPVQEGDSFVFFPVAYMDEMQSGGWITSFSTWHPPFTESGKLG